MAAESIASITPLKSRRRFLSGGVGDNIFYWATLLFAASVLGICVWISYELFQTAMPAIKKFGLPFLWTSIWNPSEDAEVANSNVFGAWPYIYGTLVSSGLALLLAVPIGLGTAIFLAELSPRWMRTPLSFLVELLAAVPSVVYGLWGRLVMVPALLPLQGWLSEHWGRIPFFAGPPQGYSMMAGALILAIMVLPFITAVSREVISAVPPSQREAAFGLGATRWEAISGPVLRYARSGIIGAIILGLARALGETMAITMVIGNGQNTSVSLLSPANTLASKLANQFAEAGDTEVYALMYLAVVLFGITIVVNALARLLIWNMARGMKGASRE